MLVTQNFTGVIKDTLGQLEFWLRLDRNSVRGGLREEKLWKQQIEAAVKEL